MKRSLKEQMAISAGGGGMVNQGLIAGGPLGGKKKKLPEGHCPCEGGSKWKVIIDKPISDEAGSVLKQFLRFCQKKLQIKQPPVIHLLSKRSPGMTTGGYSPGDNTIMALSANRLLLDVLKTLAHELTHRMQDERGDFSKLKPRVDENDNSDLNTDYENEAYINSGNYVKEFCRLYRGEEKERLYSLHESLREAPRPEALPTDPFGQYLFGQTRKLPGPKREPDTTEEDDLEDAMEAHFHGGMEELNPWIPIISNLEKKGKYKPVLSVPAKYKFAYRVMHNVDFTTLSAMLSKREPETTPKKLISAQGGVFRPMAGRPHYSWSVDPKVIKKIFDDWGSFTNPSKAARTGGPAYIVFLRAPIHQWSNEFLLNPDQTGELAQEYDYQKEIVSVGEIDCDRIWYMNVKEGPARDDNVLAADAAAVSQFGTANRKEKPTLKPRKVK